MRIAAEGSKFGVPAAKLGLGYEFEGVRKLVDVVGPTFAKEIFFTARTYDANEVLAMGLATRLFPDADFATLSGQYLAAIAENAPLSLSAAKLTLREFDRPESSRDFADAEAMVAACYESADYAEGRLAFTQKRPPVFLGR